MKSFIFLWANLTLMSLMSVAYADTIVIEDKNQGQVNFYPDDNKEVRAIDKINTQEKSNFASKNKQSKSDLHPYAN